MATALALAFGGLAFAAVIAAPAPVSAAPPIDDNPTAPTQPFEASGYTLTDPNQPTGDKTYYMGVYSTGGGRFAICTSYGFDYMSDQYEYAYQDDLSSYSGISNAQVHQIAYLWAKLPAAQLSSNDNVGATYAAAVSVIYAEPAFMASYNGYLASQLDALGLTASITALIAEAQAYAGPYATSVTLDSAPVAGGTGSASIITRSAAGNAVPGVTTNVSATGVTLTSPATVSADASGVAHASFSVPTGGFASGSISGQGVGLATDKMTIAFPGQGRDCTDSYINCAQRGAASPATVTTSASPGSVPFAVTPPNGQTQVNGGTGGRFVGDETTDHFHGENYLPGATYSYTATLQDSAGLVCGSVTGTAVASLAGVLDFDTDPIKTCGQTANTWWETVTDSNGTVIVTTPPGLPPETYPVKPNGQTQVNGGNGGRFVGAETTDHFAGNGFVPGTYTYTATLQDSAGLVCGTVTGTAVASATGVLDFNTAAIKTCGQTSNTWWETVKDSNGTVIVTTPPGIPSETYPVKPNGQTQVNGGNGGRFVGAETTDHFAGNGFVPGTYTYTATLQDDDGLVCGTVTGTAVATPAGVLEFDTAAIKTCGHTSNTWWETVKDPAGTIVVTTPPGVPSETYDVKPSGHTQVVDGNGARNVGDKVQDTFSGSGFAPGVYTVTGELYDSADTLCGTSSATVTVKADGLIDVTLPAVTVCGVGTATYTDWVTDSAGVKWLTLPKGQPSESFPITVVAAAAAAAASTSTSLVVTGAGGNNYRTVGIALGLLMFGGLLLMAARRRSSGSATS